MKEIKANITIYEDDGSETDITISADNWQHLLADISLYARGEDEKEKNFIKN